MAINTNKPNTAKETGGNLDTQISFQKQELRLLESILAELKTVSGLLIGLQGPISEAERPIDNAPIN